MTTDLEALYTTPAANTPPRVPADHLRTASLIALALDTPTGNALGWWLRDTASIHRPDETGRRCERDGDDYPCQDVRGALKFAELATAQGELLP